MDDRRSATTERMEQAVEALEKLCPALEAMWEAILKMIRAVIESIKIIYDAWRQAVQASKQFNEGMEAFISMILMMCESRRRWGFYVKLTRWHLPHRVAEFIARRSGPVVGCQQ